MPAPAFLQNLDGRIRARSEGVLHSLSADVKRRVGLGKAPNVIPVDPPADAHGPARMVQIGFHPAQGALGKHVGDLVKRPHAAAVKELLARQPDPTCHWAVVVDGIYHELNGDIVLVPHEPGEEEKKRTLSVHIPGVALRVLYQNGRIEKEGAKDAWQFFTTPEKTCFNDNAIREAAEKVIDEMPAYYDLIHNNCQIFVLHLLDAILDGGRTTGYVIADGMHKPLTLDSMAEPAAIMEPAPADAGAVSTGHVQALQSAASVMTEKTPRGQPPSQESG